MFALIVNETVAETFTALPKSWGNVSGFDKADAATVKAAGFLPLVEDRPANVEPWQTVTGPSYKIGATKVTATYAVTDKPLADYQAECVGLVKKGAATRLAPTDWYVTRWAETNTAIPEAVAERRAAIRATSNAVEEAINTATDHAAVKAAMVFSWPGEEQPTEA